MFSIKRLCFAVFLFISPKIYSSDIRISDINWIHDQASNQNKISFTLSWNNSWRNEKNYDAAWLVIKYVSTSAQGGYRHAKIQNEGHRLLKNNFSGSPNAVLEIPNDRTGLFIYPGNTYRGNISWTLSIDLDPAILKENNFSVNNRIVDIAAIEMVYIPEGSFTLGETDTAEARKHYALFASDGSGKPEKLYQVNNETPIVVSPSKGNLYYHSQTAIYHGDQKGTVPVEFPKGFRAFYIMKYETNQGDYAQFLNSISANASYARVNFGGKDYYLHRGNIRFENEKYKTSSPYRPNNFFSWDDAMAFADWAGLRPITELEFEKAARGPLSPIPREYPWNTSAKENLRREVSKTTNDVVMANGVNESELNDKNRDQFGASFFWVMDLAGSLWERCITIGDSTGRAFTGSHGDGVLSGYGFATNNDWPKGSTETAGFGFKGGGYYEHSRTFDPAGFNPFSPIGNRNFGSWAGGARSVAYGSRFGRSVLPASIIKL